MSNPMAWIALTAGVVFTATPALAEETRCTGTIGAVSLDNVRVPDGRSCTLAGTRLNGSLVVGTNSSLTATGIRVNGNIQSEGSRFVSVSRQSTVGGSVQLKQGGSIRLASTSVTGDVQFDANAGRISASTNRVNGNFQIVNNIGGVALNRNTIRGSLQCKENEPAPTGAGNAAGDKEDQCEAL